jgi:hypothetical protein
MATDRPELPWVLLRKGRPAVRFAALPLAQRFYDQLRHNAGVQEDAAIFGPNREAWYCARVRTAYWIRDDDRRKRESAVEPAEPESAT